VFKERHWKTAAVEARRILLKVVTDLIAAVALRLLGL